jgi:hypothetical protein
MEKVNKLLDELNLVIEAHKNLPDKSFETNVTSKVKRITQRIKEELNDIEMKKYTMKAIVYLVKRALEGVI